MKTMTMMFHIIPRICLLDGTERYKFIRLELILPDSWRNLIIFIANSLLVVQIAWPEYKLQLRDLRKLYV